MEYQSQDTSVSSLEVSPAMKEDFRTTIKWGKFLAIIGFIGLGIIILSALSMMMARAALSARYSSALGALFSVGYIVFAGLYFYPTYALFKFCSLTNQGIEGNNQSLLDEGFRYLKNMFRFSGILTIVMLSLMLLMFIGALSTAATN